MFDIGFLELVIIAVIGLLVLGPERLPVAARKAGRWVGKARRMVNQFSSEIDRQIEAEELREQLKAQGESLNIEEDIKKIQSTVNEALHQAEEFEPLPRNDEKDTSGNATLSNIQQRK
ncbi:MAG: twin-arginine translocase subunit TatB [Oleiphilus sp.]|nr:MAG: twin-arginine translocase subunit TatB [Oleiphilus sp.]